jgi:acetyl-CoA acyltransferase 2
MLAIMKGIDFLANREVVIVSGARTPFGAYLGSLSGMTATQLAVHASKEAISRAKIDPKEIDQAIFGNVMQSSSDAAYLARHVALYCGMTKESTAITLNRLCGSGFQSILSAAEQIMLGQAKIVLAGGTENMSQAPHVMRNFRKGYRLGNAVVEDSLQQGLTDSYNKLPMGVTAENIAKDFKITRQMSDEFSLRSQVLYKEALDKGVFKDEIAPISMEVKGKTVVIDQDEHPRETTLEKLSKLPLVFDQNGVVTAGSSSGIVDGAAAVIVMSKAEAERRKIPYLGTLVSFGISGCDPDRMGMGPVASSQIALRRFGKTINDMDMVEINEAFAAQVLGVEMQLGIQRNKFNIHGGAISVGHPLGASGTRISLHTLLGLKRSGQRYGLAGACIGGGQGITLIFESSK